MVSIYDVEPRKLIEEAAKQLEKMPEMAPPEWAAYVKTGRHRERPPQENNWWYIRSAAVLRSVYKLGPIGVSKLRTKYGGRKNRGHKPDKVFKASGNILRKILQKLELIGFVKQAEKGVHKGRIITPKGKSFIDKIVVKIKEPYKATKKSVKLENVAQKAIEKPREEKLKPKPKKAEKKPGEKKEVVKEKPVKEEKPKTESKKEEKKETQKKKETKDKKK